MMSPTEWQVLPQRDLDPRQSQTPQPCIREPLELTIVERTLVRVALGLPGRASDIALAGVLPILALEIGIRVAGRLAMKRLRASIATTPV